MKKFSDDRLELMKLWGLPFNLKSAKSAIDEYKKDAKMSRLKFTVSVNKFYALKSGESTNLINLYEKAVLFRNNKKLRKELFDIAGQNIMLILMLITPFILPSLFLDKHFNFWDHILIYLVTFVVAVLFGLLLMPIISFITNFKIKIGRAISGLINFLLLIFACSSIYYALDIDEGIMKGGILSAYCLFYLILIISSVSYFVEFLVDAVYFTDKINLSDELIIESAYRLSIVNWELAVKKRSERQNTIYEIERLASLIEKDWSSHIIPSDERTDKWKNGTLKGIASSLRKNKRKLIIPSLETPKELREIFKTIFEKILKHDIQGLLDEEVPASRIRKKSRFTIVQSFIVAILPITVGLIIKNYFPTLIDEEILHIGIAIGGIWLLISILLWLDPNLADKMATIKSFRDVIKGGNSE